MTYSLFAAIFWIRTIIINMVLIGLVFIFSGKLSGLFILFFLFVGAVLLTFPLLVLIIQVAKISTRLPYVLQARFAWLVFMLILIGVFFYAIMGLPIDSSIFQLKSEISYFFWGTTISILCAGLFSRKLFKKLNIRYEQQLV